MGGGDWTQQQIQLDRAYESVPVHRPLVEKTIGTATVEVPQPDFYDTIYVGLRSILPDWMLLLFIIVGAITMAMVCFRKQIRGLIDMWSEFLKWRAK